MGKTMGKLIALDTRITPHQKIGIPHHPHDHGTHQKILIAHLLHNHGPHHKTLVIHLHDNGKGVMTCIVVGIVKGTGLISTMIGKIARM